VRTDTGENAGSFHDHRAAGAVVGGTVGRDPAVQMSARHHVARGRIGAGNVGKNVVGIVVGVLEVDPAVDLELHVAELRQSCQAAVVLRADFYAGKFGGLADAIAVALAMHHAPVAARHLHPGEGAFLRQESIQFGSKAKPVDALLPGFRIEDRLLVFVQLDDVRVAQTLKRRFDVVLRRTGPGHQHDFPRQFALPLGKILVCEHGCNDDRGVQRAVGRRRPGNGNAAQIERARGGHSHPREFYPPAAAKVEAVGPHVLQSPTLELIRRPAFGPAHGRGIGQPPADLVGEIRRNVHHLAMIERRIGDAVEGDGFHCRRRGRERRYSR
jgi:hypothetical protein